MLHMSQWQGFIWFSSLSKSKCTLFPAKTVCMVTSESEWMLCWGITHTKSSCTEEWQMEPLLLSACLQAVVIHFCRYVFLPTFIALLFSFLLNKSRKLGARAFSKRLSSRRYSQLWEETQIIKQKIKSASKPLNFGSQDTIHYIKLKKNLSVWLTDLNLNFTLNFANWITIH